jgi:type IV pilus assembly protein PilV
LIEVLVSLVVTMFVFLGLMQTALLGLDANLKNMMRDEAVIVAETQMNQVRNTPINDLAPGVTTATATRTFRNISNIVYTLTQTVTDLGAGNKQIQIEVEWLHKGQTSTHSITAIVR